MSRRNAVPDIVQLIPPPPRPPHDWSQTESLLGFRYPPDFRDLVDAYGGGIFCDDIILLYPESTPEGCAAYRELITDLAEHVIGTAEIWTPEHKYSAFPASGGILPCVVNFERDRVGWLMVGEPEDWPTFTSWGGAGYQVVPDTVTEVLLDWIKLYQDDPRFGFCPR